jgi:hypothetical protein
VAWLPLKTSAKRRVCLFRSLWILLQDEVQYNRLRQKAVYITKFALYVRNKPLSHYLYLLFTLRVKDVGLHLSCIFLTAPTARWNLSGFYANLFLSYPYMYIYILHVGCYLCIFQIFTSGQNCPNDICQLLIRFEVFRRILVPNIILKWVMLSTNIQVCLWFVSLLTYRRCIICIHLICYKVLHKRWIRIVAAGSDCGLL